MSHIVTIKTEIRDANAVRAGCQRLGLPQPVAGTHALFSGQIAGLTEGRVGVGPRRSNQESPLPEPDENIS